ncbi:Ovarian tumor, otubain [Metarhizium robertsii ARSEF 23]|uniref:Ovarian tumor, otubain n=1 Tax=Metarhizium robertsii (strain ARSEF 23 / ATCC MYA-3075) TaxID=655844 RepID=E9ESV8_METRA|nr:Ovarian tumor, otubain [Metarhizium robertsii ARSEF 23]EFZ01773.1 Ovarian tumor, otubain [Metarhizium robertsii ARSEF 23]
MEGESLDQMTARHRRELKDLQGRITSKKKNATKKTRKGVNDECSGMERELREKQAAEVASLDSTPRDVEPEPEPDADDDTNTTADEANGLERAAAEADDEAIDAAVDKLRLNGDAPPPPAGKKRNRQKERLARRAAEQEAAAQQASEEASGMTDHRARESEYMRRTIAAHGLVEKDIEPDGHCLTVRRAAAAYMGDNGDDFAPFLEGGDLGSHVARVRDTAEWGGQLELTALARRYGAEIRVVQDGRTERIGEEEGARTGRVLWLAYYRHGYGLGEHYNSLRRK